MTVPTMSPRGRFLAAATGKPVDTTPVWFMRQAGRALPEYRALRAKHSFMEVAMTPELCAEATLMPVDLLGVDGAVLFADIMLPLDGMGCPFRIEPNIGPVIPDPIRTAADVERLRVVCAEEGTPYVLEGVRLLRRSLGDRAALLGFAGAPFTLACYMIEGRSSREYPRAKAMMYGQPDVWHSLMQKLTDTTILYLKGQIEAGAEVVQLFDSWLGLLGPRQYETFVLPHTRRIFEELRGLAPTIHFSTGTVQLMEQIASAGSDIVSVDWRLPIDVAWDRIGHGKGIQGNLDPTMLTAPWEPIEAESADVLRRIGNRDGHIFNLGHGILPETPPDTLKRLAEFVHAAAAR